MDSRTIRCRFQKADRDRVRNTTYEETVQKEISQNFPKKLVTLYGICLRTNNKESLHFVVMFFFNYELFFVALSWFDVFWAGYEIVRREYK